MSNPISLDVALQQIVAGKLSPRRLVDRCLHTIRRYEPQVRAWVLVDEPGIDRHLSNLSRGPHGALHGIPVGIKDIIDVAGLPTRAGSPLRLGDQYIARTDAPLVARLRRQGAIILGKTVTTEFAYLDPPPSKNPWDPQLQHTPGGSSSGSAVAVALGMCLGAVGTQTGGSLIRPAAYCGIAALKPTFGEIPTDGVIPSAHHLDVVGPMARRVADLIRLWRVMADRLDHQATDATLPPRLGLPLPYFFDQADPSVRRVVEATLDRLRAAGATVVPVDLPAGFAAIHDVHRRINAFEAAAYHHQAFQQHRDAYGPKLRQLLDEGLTISEADYAQARAAQDHFGRETAALLATVDALITPATHTTAPARLDTTGDSRFQAPWSCAGVPAVTFPCGLADDAMPVGLQLVGRHHADLQLLQVAHWCEQQIPFTALPPLLTETL